MNTYPPSPEQETASQELFAAQARYESLAKKEEAAWNQVRYGNAEDRLLHRDLLNQLADAKLHLAAMKEKYSRPAKPPEA